LFVRLWALPFLNYTNNFKLTKDKYTMEKEKSLDNLVEEEAINSIMRNLGIYSVEAKNYLNMTSSEQRACVKRITGEEMIFLPPNPLLDSAHTVD